MKCLGGALRIIKEANNRYFTSGFLLTRKESFRKNNGLHKFEHNITIIKVQTTPTTAHNFEIVTIDLLGRCTQL